MPLDLWLAFVAATTVLLLIPGPTVLLVLSYAISQGRRVAVASALGVALGDLIAMSASLFGLGVLVATSAALFGLLKWVGAIYLVWLGVKMLRATDSSGLSPLAPHAPISPRAIFGHTATVTALNPKSIGFFIAFVPQFIQPESALAPQFALMIATFVTLGGLNALAYALLADRLRNRISRPNVITWLTRSGGITLIAMGFITATLRRST